MERALLTAWLLAALALSCTGSSSSATVLLPDATDGASGGSGGTHDAGALDADAKPHDGGALDADAKNDSGKCSSICYADSPCWVQGVTDKCRFGHPTERLVAYSIPCSESCGTPCCSGESCSFKLELCEAGTLCAFPKAEPGSSSPVAACVPEELTCPSDAGCPEGQYCEVVGVLCESQTSYCYSMNACAYADAGGLGTCRLLPEAGCDGDAGKECGCDGITYDNSCDRKKAGIPLYHVGSCS